MAAAPAARAHLVTTGLGPVYDGIGHLLLSPDNLAMALALACFAGLRGTAAGRRSSVLVPVAWFVGGLAGALGPTTAALEALLPAASLLVVGVMLAADREMPLPATSLFVAALGAANGYANGGALAEAGWMGAALQLLGIAALLVIVATLSAAVAVAARGTLFRYLIRIAGSWTAATGLLLIGWYFRTRR